MDTKEKRLLFEYVKLHEPIWEISEFHGKGKRGIYRLWAYPSSTWSDDLEIKGMSVLRFDGYDKWKLDGFISWEAVQGIVDRHRAGKILRDLAEGLTRTVSNITWS